MHGKLTIAAILALWGCSRATHHFLPSVPQPWAGIVALTLPEQPKALRIDGKALALSAMLPAAMLDTRTLEDGSHRAEVEWQDGWVDAEAFETRNPVPEAPLASHFSRVDVGWTADGASADRGEAMRGAVAGDFDGDGDLDVFAWEPERSRVFLQDGPWRFDEVPTPIPPQSRVSAAAVADLDGDGTDELLANADQLYVLGWRDGALTSRAVDFGIPQAATAPATGFHLGDFDGDGLLDFSMARVGCGQADRGAFLFLNEGDGHFREAAKELGLSTPQSAPLTLVFERPAPGLPVQAIPFTEGCAPFSWWIQRFAPGAAGPVPVGGHLALPGEFAAMGSVKVDVDGDGTLELFVAGTGRNPAYAGRDYQQDLAGIHGLSGFSDASGGISEQWGMALVDVEMRGLPSVVAVQGNNRPDLGSALRPRGQLLWQHAKGRFTESAKAAGLDFEGNCRSLQAADLDGDGDADLVAGCREGVRVFRNDGDATRARTVVLRGTLSNPPAIDAQLRVVGTGERRQVWGGGQTLAAAATRESMRLSGDTLEVTWPSGLVQQVAAGETPVVQVREPEVLELATRRVAPGAAPVKVVLRPGAAGARAGTLELANAEWAAAPQADAEGALIGAIRVPSAEAVVTLTARLDGRELLVHPKLFVRR